MRVRLLISAGQLHLPSYWLCVPTKRGFLGMKVRNSPTFIPKFPFPLGAKGCYAFALLISARQFVKVSAML